MTGRQFDWYRDTVVLGVAVGCLMGSVVTPRAQTPSAPTTPPPAMRQPGRPPFAAVASQTDDALTAQPRYPRPEYSLHDLAGLPDWLSLGLEHRTRYEVMDGRFRKDERGSDRQVALQTALFLEARWASWRVGGEFLDARAVGTDRQSFENNTHTDVADFLQYYLAWSTRDLGGSGLALDVKGGRQTLDLGGRRLVARNAFRNTVNTFTGLTFRIRAEGQWQATLFGAQPILRVPDDPEDIRHGVHEWDEQEYRSAFSGIFVESAPLLGGISGEAYVFHLYEQDRPASQTRNRRLVTPGLRLMRPPARGAFDVELEGVVQAGRSRASTSERDRRDLDHRAWFVHAQAGYTLDAAWAPRLILMHDYASGDEDPNDRATERFDTLFGARRWELGPTGIFGPFARSNIQSPGLRATASPVRLVSLALAYRAFWLAAARDAWVGSGLQDRTGRSGDFLGHLVEATIRWDASTNIAFEAGYATLVKGRFARTAPGAPRDGDVNYGYVQSILRF